MSRLIFSLLLFLLPLFLFLFLFLFLLLSHFSFPFLFLHSLIHSFMYIILTESCHAFLQKGTWWQIKTSALNASWIIHLLYFHPLSHGPFCIDVVAIPSLDNLALFCAQQETSVRCKTLVPQIGERRKRKGKRVTITITIMLHRSQCRHSYHLHALHFCV